VRHCGTNNERLGFLRSLARLAHVAPQADEAEAASLLGPDHDLVRVLARRRALFVQILITFLPLAFAVVGLVRGTASAPVVLGAAALVQLTLLLAVPYLRARTREIAEELIGGGHDASLRVRIVARHHRRLTSPEERERIARSLEHLLRDARRWYSLAPVQRPLGVVPLRSSEPEARDVVALLRTDGAQARGVALTARLLEDGASPLYGDEPDELREELCRIRYLLAAPRPQSVEHDRLAA
jgi:hypothetical protein